MKQYIQFILYAGWYSFTAMQKASLKTGIIPMFSLKCQGKGNKR